MKKFKWILLTFILTLSFSCNDIITNPTYQFEVHPPTIKIIIDGDTIISDTIISDTTTKKKKVKDDTTAPVIKIITINDDTVFKIKE